MLRAEYIEWHTEHYGVPPKSYLLEKYYPVEKESKPTTEKDWEEFWQSIEPQEVLCR